MFVLSGYLWDLSSIYYKFVLWSCELLFTPSALGKVKVRGLALGWTNIRFLWVTHRLHALTLRERLPGTRCSPGPGWWWAHPGPGFHSQDRRPLPERAGWSGMPAPKHTQDQSIQLNKSLSDGGADTENLLNTFWPALQRPLIFTSASPLIITTL